MEETLLPAEAFTEQIFVISDLNVHPPLLNINLPKRTTKRNKEALILRVEPVTLLILAAFSANLKNISVIKIFFFYLICRFPAVDKVGMNKRRRFQMRF